MDKKSLQDILGIWKKKYSRGQRGWSFGHHCCLFGSIICSISAGTLLQIDKVNLTTKAAILTSIAAVLTGITVSGGFDRKWQSNRLSRSHVDRLLLDLEKDNPNLEAILTSLQDIIDKHDNQIVSEKPKP